jgi:hypothetical protein
MMNSGTNESNLRVSVATLNQVIFSHPQTSTLMLALERKASVIHGGRDKVRVRAQPFGGAVHILNSNPLKQIIGEIKYDSEKSKREQDFRILIPVSQWELVKQYCLHHLENPDDPELESTSNRELVEEFEETMDVKLSPNQYTVQPMRFVIENNPVPTDNEYGRSQLTTHIYRIFKVQVVDIGLCQTILTASHNYSDQELGMLALRDFQNGGRGRAHSALALPIHFVVDSYLALPPETRFGKLAVGNHELDESVLAILDVDVPQYQRL